MRTTLKAAGLAAICTALWAISATAQDYPTRQINMVVPFPPVAYRSHGPRPEPNLPRRLGNRWS